MNPPSPLVVHHAEWDRGLFWMVVVSALAHLGGLALILVLPHRFALRPKPITAYTVDLVSSDQLAGTNLIPGSKGKVEAPAKVEPQPPPPPPPAPKVEEVKKPEPPPPEPQKVEPKPVEDDKAVKLAAATQPKAAQPTPTPIAQAKAEVAKPKPDAKPAPAVASTRAVAQKPSGTPTLTKAEVAARERDDRIAKAIAKIKNEGSKSGGTGKAGGQPGGGPISVGPGSGPGGGVVKGLEYLLYYNQMMARLKDAWAWAGRSGLEAVVAFRIAEDGEVSDIRITQSSGDATYDATVLRAVRAVSPLAPPPEAYRKEFSEVEITFSPSSMNM